MSRKFDDFLDEQLRDEEFRKEYGALQPERAIIRAIIDARKQTGLTQKEMSERTGIVQATSVNWSMVTPIHPSERFRS